MPVVRTDGRSFLRSVYGHAVRALVELRYKACRRNCEDFYIDNSKRLFHEKTKHFKSLTKNDHYSAIVDHVTATIYNIKLRSFWNFSICQNRLQYHCNIQYFVFVGRDYVTFIVVVCNSREYERNFYKHRHYWNSSAEASLIHGKKVIFRGKANKCAAKVGRAGIRNVNREYGEVLWWP